ncbi:AAA family ATPase [Clostridium sp. chh4-2]|uniref:RNA-binding domain-containing protein n=1 Tax=Clostridium sp. chh4-2 TaxID=2067550 RepID=UPI000CCDE4E6|nr:RNA-binding domain-containing protein [Clostridium sp. chh4-2]PNV62531.1 AAA family ATPase [Clostridium sp. chh4-2]
MSKSFELSQFDSYKEDNRREVKKANGGLPNDMWETYSAYANTYGGVIILGVKELENKHWKTTGLKAEDKEKLLDNLWNLLHNPKKVNINLLSETDVEIYEVGEDIIIVIEVPMAKRSQKPVYINGDMFTGTYRRTNSGDYRCTRLQVKAMLRDQTENTVDMDVLDDAELSDLNSETIQGYRNRHRTLKAGHPFERLDDAEYLRSIGAAAISKEDKRLHPTAAGMLMFGEEFNIVRHFPEYFLDYREMLDPAIRWTDRLQSSSGEWSGNICDFYFRVYNKIIKDIKVPFKMVGGDRIDDTPVHKALREALANCLINTDFYGVRGVVIKKEPDKLILANPGYIRTGKQQMRIGGESDPRNKALMKMFNLINIGERAGSGVPNIFNVWADEGWVEPVIEEWFDPDRTVLSLEFKKASDKKQAIKTSDKKQANKTSENISKIRSYLLEQGASKTSDIAKFIGLSAARTRAIIAKMDDVEGTGANRSRTYRLKE